MTARQLPCRGHTGRDPPSPHWMTETSAWIGTAGWSLPREEQAEFPGEGTHLERYGARFPAVEINSSFYRPHRPSTYARWAASVPDHFRFSVKVPKQITHVARLRESEAALDAFLEQATHLGHKLGSLLVQLPPSLAFDPPVAERFFAMARERFQGGIACEPRHATWLEPEAESLLVRCRVARVAADPDRPPGARQPGGWDGLRYYRYHGSPRIYYSTYLPATLAALADAVSDDLASGRTVWCILDNTALGAATHNALDLLNRVRGAAPAGGIHPATGDPSTSMTNRTEEG